jgi:hypothetical protein
MMQNRLKYSYWTDLDTWYLKILSVGGVMARMIEAGAV